MFSSFPTRVLLQTFDSCPFLDDYFPSLALHRTIGRSSLVPNFHDIPIGFPNWNVMKVWYETTEEASALGMGILKCCLL
jgi:hypothetical protein